MITAISNNFGGEGISFKCYDSTDIVVIQGKFTVDIENEDFLAAEQLEIALDAELKIKDSLVSSCYMSHVNSDIAFCTPLRCYIKDGNRLLIEKLEDFVYRSEVTVWLASGFVAKGGSQIFQTLSSSKITLTSDTSGFSATWGRYANHFEEKWGFMAGQFSSFQFTVNEEESITMTGFPEDVDIDVPFLYLLVNTLSIMGTPMVPVNISSGKINIRNVAVIPNGSTTKIGFFFFFVREPAGEEEAGDDQDGTEN